MKLETNMEEMVEVEEKEAEEELQADTDMRPDCSSSAEDVSRRAGGLTRQRSTSHRRLVGSSACLTCQK